MYAVFNTNQVSQKDKIIVYYYIIISYIIGFILIVLDIFISPFYWSKRYIYGIIMFLLSPIIAWHGVLHWLQIAYCRLTKQPDKFWI